MSGVVIDLYTVQIVRDDNGRPFGVSAYNVSKMMAEAEENLTDLLPAGYRARIRRWDDITDEPTQEDNDE